MGKPSRCSLSEDPLNCGTSSHRIAVVSENIHFRMTPFLFWTEVVPLAGSTPECTLEGGKYIYPTHVFAAVYCFSSSGLKSSRNSNPQMPSSSFPGDIPIDPNDPLFFQNVNTTVEQHRRDADDLDATRQSSSTSHAVLPNHVATPQICPPAQASSYTRPQTMVKCHGIHLSGDMVIIIQHPYQSGLPLNYPRGIPRIYYGGFSLQNAVAKNFGNLQDSDQLAWADDIQLPSKLAIVLWFPGYPRYKHQVTILRAHHQPPTRGTLAQIMAREMKKFLDMARTGYQRPLRWQSRELTLSDLFLIDIEQVSRGSLQPRIGTRRDMARPGFEFVQPMNVFPPVPGVAY